MKKYFLIMGVILIFLASACSQQPEQAAQPKVIIAEETPKEEVTQPETSTEESPKPIEATKESPLKAEVPAPSVKEFDITAKQFEFIPSAIVVNKGDKLKLSINSADVTHGFSIPEYGINENINPGKTTIVEFTADKTGEFTFFCSVYCGTGHKSMKGKLIVE